MDTAPKNHSNCDHESRVQKTSSWVGAISTFLLSLVPVFKSCPPCPMCMPKYAAVLSFLGVPLADYSHYLMPIMLVSMVFTIISLAIQGPKYYASGLSAYLALLACAIILIARYNDLQAVNYLGMALLFAALVFHQFKMRQHKESCCNHNH